MRHYYQETTAFKRNCSSYYLDSSSDDEPSLKRNRVIPNLDFRGSNRGARDCSVEANITRSGKAVPVINVHEKNKLSKTKRTAKMSSLKSAGKRRRECYRNISVAMDDLEKLSKSLIDELKVDYQKMLEQMKINLGISAAENYTLMPKKNKGTLIRYSSRAREKRSTHPEPQHAEHLNSSSSNNFITPAGHLATTMRFNYGRESLMKTAVNRRAGYFTNLLRQVSYPGNWSSPRQNNIQTFGMGSTRFPLPIGRRLGNSTSHFPNPIVAQNSSGGGPITFPGRSHASTNSFPANRFEAINFYDNFKENEALRRQYLRHYGNFR